MAVALGVARLTLLAVPALLSGVDLEGTRGSSETAATHSEAVIATRSYFDLAVDSYDLILDGFFLRLGYAW